MLDYLKKQWGLLAELAGWLSTVIGGFWREPPVGSAEVSSGLRSFGQFYLTLAVGLLAIPAYRYREKRHLLWWLIAAVVLTISTPVAYFAYQWLATAWTCPYAGTRVVIGSDADLTEHGRSYRNSDPNLTDAEVLWNHAGAVEQVWKGEAIEKRRLELEILYVAFLPLFAGGAICVIQAVYCATR